MKLESSIATVAKPIEDVFDQLTQASTYELLMPEEASFRIRDEKHFSFKLGGMPVIPLKLERQTPNTQIVMAADGGSVPFELHANLEAIDGKTKIQLVFEGNINPMMQMMVKKPLTQFLEALIANAGKL
ncbi:SRPBCC family protein [Flavobacteriaceae bacterium]|mgnify:FL=1|jgi:carbon monoxide dehydrogenase subunit G|nr:SRPBCC family protein [Flavobacteriaceae bacterium]MDG1723674.1 SRPBCC family protein [Flavobacteriaceae bacterium]MDG2290831.1 SRPBCC family protein [Flavobacteriaceae bacterium]